MIVENLPVAETYCDKTDVLRNEMHYLAERNAFCISFSSKALSNFITTLKTNKALYK